jgi:predicted glutamine amidotransferase
MKVIEFHFVVSAHWSRRTRRRVHSRQNPLERPVALISDGGSYGYNRHDDLERLRGLVVMCELLAVSARFPTTVKLSLDELARHGGGTGPHRDGWGVVLADEGDAVVIREAQAAHDSPWIQFLDARAPRTNLAIAHVRKATHGARTLRNTQPFTRELGGQLHVFAHNGMLDAIDRNARFAPRRFRPIGETDSEVAFCALLERLSPLWENGANEDDRLREIAGFAADLRALGPANFLYANGDTVIAHGHERKQNDGVIASPGLHVLCRSCSATSDAVPFAGVSIDPEALQEVAVVASVPLSNEPWSPLESGEIVVLRGGRVIRRIKPPEARYPTTAP